MNEEQNSQPRIERFSRSSVEHTDDLFKLKVASGKRNVSWKFREPSTVSYEHCHFFHSINDTTTQPNKHSTPTGGHFHEVTVERDAEGNILNVKCGPAMEMVVRKVGKDRQIKRPAPVQFESYLSDSEQEKLSHAGQPIPEFTLIKDQHVHELEYLGSETFTAKGKTQARENEKAKIKGVSQGEAVSTQPTAQMGLISHKNTADVGRLLTEVKETARNADGTDATPPVNP